jgi:hypothetical protein
MIEGLKVTIAGTELRDLCETRSKYHLNRVQGYKTKLEQVKGLDLSGSGKSSVDPTEEIENKIREHDLSAAELQFIADHLDTHESYLLDRNDLYKLGVTSRSY